MNPLLPTIIQGIIEAVVNTQGATAPDAAPTFDVPAGMLRAIPNAAEKAVMNPSDLGTVKMDGKPMRLSPASQIRDEYNRIIMPMMLQEKPVTVRYTKDAMGNVHQVWILTRAEAEAPAPEKTQ